MSDTEAEMAGSHAAAIASLRERVRPVGAFLKRHVEGLIYLYIAVAVCALGLFMDHLGYERFMASQRELVQSQAASLTSKVAGDLTNKAIMLRGLDVLIDNDPNMSQERYAKIASELIYDYPGIINIAAAPDLVVRYVYPKEKNRSVLGFDYRTSAEQYPDVRRARNTGQTVISGPVTLVQGGTAFIVRTPVIRKDAATGYRTFWGVISAVIDAKFFFRQTGLSDPDLPISVSLRRLAPDGSGGKVIFGDRGIFGENPVLTKLDLSDGTWQLAAVPKGGWPTHGDGAWIFRLTYAAAVLLLLGAVRYFNVLLRRRRLAERRLQDAINALDDGFVLYDENDRLVTCNRKYREIYSVTEDMFVPGTPFESIIRAGIRSGQFADNVGPPEEWIRKRLAAHRSGLSESQQQLSNGRWLKVTDRRTPDGSNVGLRVDVTELRNAMEAAQAASRAKTDFLNVLSHELRTPLTVILGNARLLSRQDELPQVRKLRETLEASDGTGAAAEQVETTLAFLRGLSSKVEASGEHLLRLITEMLDFSKIEAGQMELDIEPVEVLPLLGDVLDGFRASAAKKGLSLICDAEDIRVSADRLRLTQILINLVGNAMKFTDSGEIRLSARERGSRVEISVSDTGCGIAYEHLEMIFETFRQVDSSSSRKAGGTGLGLAITRRLVELHGGVISVASEPGRGSVFRLSLPAVAAEAKYDCNTGIDTRGAAGEAQHSHA